MAEKNETLIRLTKEQNALQAILSFPKGARAIVVFSHGSGSGRLSPRNQFVASYFNDQGLATLLVDLLTSEEEAVDEATRQYRFDIELLAQRLVEVRNWLASQTQVKSLPIAYFGSSTGAAAALIAAANSEGQIASVVSRGGRPDLALTVLSRVRAPTLLIVGGNDYGVIELNQQAYEQMRAPKALEIVPGATHLFDEPGTLREVARLSAAWILKHLPQKL